MTRDKLLHNICPTGTIFDCRTGNKNCDCDDCNHILEEWLDEYEKQVRADAIDEFAKKLIQIVTSMTTGFRVVGNIERIAKELKEQK